MDPGYHVARVVTVMHDEAYPHTGWFVQSEEGGCRREYRYRMSEWNSDYVAWEWREARAGGEASTTTSLVYVGRPFLSPLDVTERRNLVYNFRSWLARDSKGHVVGGLYFKVAEEGAGGGFTVVHSDPDSGLKTRRKMKFKDFLLPLQEASNRDDLLVLDACGHQLGLGPGRLASVVRKLAFILSDRDFVRQLLKINQDIINIPN